MRLPRRAIVRLGVGALVAPAVARLASAQAYPARPVRVIVGATPGSSPDVAARLLTQQLAERLGQPFVIENRAGATGDIATEAVIRATPDGYTLLLFSASSTINPALNPNLDFDFARDVRAVASIVSFPMVITVRAPFPATTLPDLIANAKADPGKIDIGTPGIGTPQHVAGELFKMTTGINLVLVPYRGGPPAINDALGGQIQGVIGTVLLVAPHLRDGGLRALASTGATRSELLPEVPTVAEYLPGFEASQWVGVGAPKDTPAAIVEKLNHEINAALAEPATKTRIANLGGTVVASSSAVFAKFVADEIEKWAKVVKFAGIKAQP